MAVGIVHRLKVATKALAGMMSAADKAKLDGIEVDATCDEDPVDRLDSDSATAPLSANQGLVLREMFEGSGIIGNNYNLSINSSTSEPSYVMQARKYGRIVMLACNTGGAIQTALAANQLIASLPEQYRPIQGLWFMASTAAGALSRISVESDGAVRVQQTVSTGSYLRFTAVYISQS